jgi:hypothetical protein
MLTLVSNGNFSVSRNTFSVSRNVFLDAKKSGIECYDVSHAIVRYMLIRKFNLRVCILSFLTALDMSARAKIS